MIIVTYPGSSYTVTQCDRPIRGDPYLREYNAVTGGKRGAMVQGTARDLARGHSDSLTIKPDVPGHKDGHSWT